VIEDNFNHSRRESRRRAFLDQLRRMDASRYVYTYPFKGAYRPYSTDSALKSWSAASGKLNLYVHFPYCEIKCSFCNLLTSIESRSNVIAHYVEMLTKEASLLAAGGLFKNYEVVSIYFGGGTPTVCDDHLLDQTLNALHRLFKVHIGAEVAIEATPDTLSAPRLSSLRALGFDRISLGIQTLNAQELRAMGRN